jgi:eukaryotic-like serine/threonine-protein kinase
MEKRPDADVVCVIESIPAGGEHMVSAEEIAREGIPLPHNLRIFPELGRGGMGRIHPAHDRNLLRPVALKRLDTRLAEEQFYRDGFVAEAQITGQLEHPNIVPVHELAIAENGVPYFTMKLVQGISFAQWLALPAHALGSTERLEEGLSIVLKVCDAVAYAHHRGVIHRDIKPENIMVGDFGQVYLMDWGLARLSKGRPASGPQAQMEAPGAVGTPGYMAPEQAAGNPADMREACDIFGIGALLYEIVSGQLPFGHADSAEEILRRTEAGEVVPIEKVSAAFTVAKRLRSIVERATQPHPQDRFPSVIELQQAIRSFLRGGLHLPRKVFRPGELILREGDVGEAAYMIINGRCRAFTHVDGTEETIGFMEAGEVIGEMALLLDEPRAASVEACGPVAVLVLDKHTMTEGLGVDGWTGALVRALAQRFSRLERTVRHSGIRRDSKVPLPQSRAPAAAPLEPSGVRPQKK